MFAHNGRLDESSYCFQLKVFDKSLLKRVHETLNVCVEVIQPATEKSHVTEKVYPDEVYLLQSASRFARVAQPLNDTDEAGFSLTANPFGVFNITTTGGIIYIANSNLLAQAHPASSIKLEVTWKEHQKQQINVIVQPNTAQCGNKTSNAIEDFCALHNNQASCESSCGVGSRDGRCKWREHKGFELMSKIFATCLPDLEFCSNQICDPLEELGSRLGQNICPQDCSKQVFGNVNTKAIGISGSSKGNVCTCDELAACLCGPVNVTEMESSSTGAPTTTKTTSSTPFPHVSRERICGLRCRWAMTVSSPFLIILPLILCIICVFGTRRDRTQFHLIESPESPLYPDDHHVRAMSASSGCSAKVEEVNETPNHPGYPDFYSKRWEVDVSKLNVERMIGEGEFGKVMLATIQVNQEGGQSRVVIKTVKDVGNDSEMSCLKKEFEQLQKVSVQRHQPSWMLLKRNNPMDLPGVLCV